MGRTTAEMGSCRRFSARATPRQSVFAAQRTQIQSIDVRLGGKNDAIHDLGDDFERHTQGTRGVRLAKEGREEGAGGRTYRGWRRLARIIVRR
jgi:hypothetical protein